jgi:uncharacterized membrane protein
VIGVWVGVLGIECVSQLQTSNTKLQTSIFKSKILNLQSKILNMDAGLLHLHNILRWVILILLLITLFQAFTKNKSIQKVSLFIMISAHTMLLIGLYQWLAGRYGIFTAEIPEGVSRMKDKFWRFYQVEHPLLMIISVALITIAHKKAKGLQYKSVAVLLIIALLLILVGIPWPFREIIGRGYFPGAVE